MSHADGSLNHEGTKVSKKSLYGEFVVRLRAFRVFVVCRSWIAVLTTMTMVALTGARPAAHSGPPFPIVSDRVAGAYQVSIWTDPDATDDRSAAGKFWVTLQPADPARRGRTIPAGTRVEVVIKPLDRNDGEVSARAEPINGETARQFAAVVMDHEGPFGVRVTVDGPLGRAEVQVSTDATYDLRPRPILIVIFVLPFVLVGFVWGKLLVKRRMLRSGGR
jgi:hypothetical protein